MSYFNESKLSYKDRKELQDEEFGIPSLRKYPLHDKAHVLQAIKMFHYAPPEHKKELAMNIKRKMREYNIPDDAIGPNNELRNYIK